MTKSFKKRGDNYRTELCNAVGQPSDVLINENVQGLVGEFGKKQYKFQDAVNVHINGRYTGGLHHG